LQPSATDEFRIGDRVLVGGAKPGILVFIGEVHFSLGDWAGIVLDTPTGKNDGKINGRRYFECEPMRGVFCRLDKLTKLAVAGGAVPAASDTDSGSRSRLNKTDSSSSIQKSGVGSSTSTKIADSRPSNKVLSPDRSAASDRGIPTDQGIPAQAPSSSHNANSDRGIPTSAAQTPSSNHSDGDNHMMTRFYVEVLFFMPKAVHNNGSYFRPSLCSLNV